MSQLKNDFYLNILLIQQLKIEIFIKKISKNIILFH